MAVDLPGVGRNLQDHLALPAIFTTTGTPSLLAAEKPAQLARYLGLRRGMLTSNVGEATGFVRTRPGLDAPDLQLIVAPVQYIDRPETKLIDVEPAQPANREERYSVAVLEVHVQSFQANPVLAALPAPAEQHEAA